jgi:short-subunit dehydrogenase involved in D-alanine esterification of teichoic acids
MSTELTTVLITGGTSGIDRATAERFGHRGAKVIVSGRDEARGRAVAAETGGCFIRADLAPRSSSPRRSPRGWRRAAAGRS